MDEHLGECFMTILLPFYSTRKPPISMDENFFFNYNLQVIYLKWFLLYLLVRVQNYPEAWEHPPCQDTEQQTVWNTVCIKHDNNLFHDKRKSKGESRHVPMQQFHHLLKKNYFNWLTAAV